jgi:hypothetical protein
MKTYRLKLNTLTGFMNIPDNNYETILLLVEKIKEILKNKAKIKLVTIKF